MGELGVISPRVAKRIIASPLLLGRGGVMGELSVISLRVAKMIIIPSPLWGEG